MLTQGRFPYALRAARLGACLLLAGCAWTPGLSERQVVIDRIVSVTTKIVVERDGRRIGSGSGVVVASGIEGVEREPVTYILTAQHVLDGNEAASIFVRFMGPNAPAGKVLARLFRAGDSATLDLALLRVTGVSVGPALLAEQEPRLGESILIAGFPWGKRFGLFGGIVSQLPGLATAGAPEEDGLTDPTLVVDAASANGVSGGGVFNEATGELLGVVEGYQTASIAVESKTRAYSFKVPVAGETFAVPAARIREFLEAGLAAAADRRAEER